MTSPHRAEDRVAAERLRLVPIHQPQRSVADPTHVVTPALRSLMRCRRPWRGRLVIMALPWSTCGLGTAALGSVASGPLWFGPQDRSTAIATVRAAVDAGITWIDTAPFYGWG